MATGLRLTPWRAAWYDGVSTLHRTEGVTVGRHSKDQTASDSDTRAGGNKMGKHEPRVNDPEQVRADELVKRLRQERGQK